MTSRVAVAAASFLLVLLPLLEVACGGSADEGNAPRTRSSQGPPTWFSGGVPGKRVQADTLVAEMARASGVDPEEIHEVVQAREGREAYVLLAAPRKDGEICLSQAAVTGSRFFMVGDFSCAPTALAPVTRFADQAMLVWQSGGGERPTVQSSMAIVGLARSDVTRVVAVAPGGRQKELGLNEWRAFAYAGRSPEPFPLELRAYSESGALLASDPISTSPLCGGKAGPCPWPYLPDGRYIKGSAP